MSKKLNIKRLEMVFEENQIPSNDLHSRESTASSSALLDNSRTTLGTIGPIPPLAQQEKVHEMIEPGCPYIGIWEDPQTSTSYPSQMNLCHRSLPLTPPALNHQKNYCLSHLYISCALFLLKSKTPMPKSIRWSR